MNKVPKLRFPQFSGEWEEKKIGEIFDFYTTNSYSRDCLNYDKGTVKNIHYGDIHMNFPTILDVNNSQIPYINEKIDLNKISKDSYCQEGDIVIADASEDYADIGKTIEIKNIGNEKIVSGLHTLLGRDNKGITENGYRGYMFLNDKVRKQIKILAVGSKVLGISKPNINKVSAYIPQNKEQQKIAQFFSIIDKKIKNQKEKVEALKDYKKGMMQKIFSQEIRFKCDNGEQYPKWKHKRLNQLVERVTRRNKSLISKLPLTISAQYGLVDQETFFNKTVASSNLENYFLLHKGEFAYNKSYSAGYPWGAIKRLDNYDMGVLSSLYICFAALSGIDSNFLVHYFETNCWHKEVSMIAVEGARNHGLLNITVSDFLETLHYIPSYEEQVKIATFLSKLENKFNKEQEKLDSLNQWKKGLLQQMFV